MRPDPTELHGRGLWFAIDALARLPAPRRDWLLAAALALRPDLAAADPNCGTFVALALALDAGEIEPPRFARTPPVSERQRAENALADDRRRVAELAPERRAEIEAEIRAEGGRALERLDSDGPIIVREIARRAGARPRRAAGRAGAAR
ncbi:MAG TPA: hypothetical protein PKC43_02100 [Phycisphaerales bacterium]|nr:hypothetical protein [Phycisphaerales bacterium]HMP36218.1 hypothetical protein [Phycisphaerales bacterium]